MNQKQKQPNIFYNEVINKKKLQSLMSLTFHNYGIIKSSIIADNVKNLTFHYATVSGISLSIEDLRVPFRKRTLIGLTNDEVENAEQNYTSGSTTIVERFQKVIDIWNNANNTLKDEVLTYFRESDPLNPLYIMAFSGARGNISQVRQLVGMRGLMADPQGQIIDLPIKSNFREGLKVTEYIISSYGARKGLVDTALRTADSGYLTRRLVDVAQDIIIRDEDCLQYGSLSLTEVLDTYKTDIPLENRLIGRLLAQPVHLPSDNLTLPTNTELDAKIVQKILKSKLTNFEVRSPLTCNALRSVCRRCYGWHLSYSKLIDLGEAVGILAAQSIGEPGTQLTMRTFHTGGVFSGDLTKQIRAPFAGTVKYSLKSKTSLVRTIHGEQGFNLLEPVNLTIENSVGTSCIISLPTDALLLVNDKEPVYYNQIIAEIKKDANLILEKSTRDIYTETSGEIFLQNIDTKKIIDNTGSTKDISKTTGLLWVLSGDRYILQGSSKLEVGLGDTIQPNQTIASQKITNKYSGIVNLDQLSNKGEIQISNSSLTIENGLLDKNSPTGPIFKLFDETNPQTFQLVVKENELLSHGQTLARLQDNNYKTNTGGIVYYSTDSLGSKKKRLTKKNFTGFLYWIAEETHKFNSFNSQQLKVQDGEFVTKGTTLFSNVTANIEGYIHIDLETSEIVIKPGELYECTNFYGEPEQRANSFVKPGEIIFSNIIIQQLSFLEILSINNKTFVLVRPVKTFKVPQDKGFSFKYQFFPSFNKRCVAFRTVKRIFYKDGERIKLDSGGVDLLQTFLVLDIQKHYSGLRAKIEYLPLIKGNENNNQYKLKLTLSEIITITDNSFNDLKTKGNPHINYSLQHNQYIQAGQTLGHVKMLTYLGGRVVGINKDNNIEMLILKDHDIKTCFYDSVNETPLVKKGDIVRVGTPLTPTIISKYAGQIYEINSQSILLRLGRPYLISAETILRTRTKSFVDKSDLLATLVYDKLKTVDIVQGLPKVEEILEARKIKNGSILAPTEGKAYLKTNQIEILKTSEEKFFIDLPGQTQVNFTNGQYVNFLEPLTDGPISPHEMLETLFNYYEAKYSINEACKTSFKQLQLFLVNEVQKTYLSQGVEIADKHIEVIVKQMTSKVKVLYGASTTLLPGEILDITQAEIVTKAAVTNGEEPPVYKPLLLGLTKASLNSDSFISAASFQETTRVLTEAAIEGKKDWLNGLKENVIIGRLIPAGTGFNSFENLKKVGRNFSANIFVKSIDNTNVKSSVLQTRLG